MAVGTLGLRLQDTYSLTFDELAAIHRARQESEELSRRERWERTRFLAHCILAPFAKKRMRPTDIIRFDWEKDDPPKATPATRQDFERIRRRYGDG